VTADSTPGAAVDIGSDRTGSSLPSGYAIAVSTAEEIPEGLRETGFTGPQGRDRL
jgi:hypothetical protein